MWLEEMGVAERLVFYVFCVVTALDLVLALAVLSLGCIYKVNTPGASMDFYIAFGSLALMVSTLIQAADPEWATDMDQLQALCKFYPSILTFGLLWFLGGLLLKASASHSYFKHHSRDHVSAHEWKPNFWMIILMILDAVLVLVWLLKFEPHLAGRDASGNMLNLSKQIVDFDNYDKYTCEGEHFELFEIVISAVHAALLLIGAIVIWAAVFYSRSGPASTETNLLSAAIYNTIFAVVGATLVYFFYDGSKSSIIAITGGATFYVIFVTLLLILIMKIIAARRLRNNRGSDVYDKVDDDRGRNSYHHDNYLNETQLPSKKKKNKEKKAKKAKKEPKPKKTKAKKTSSKRSSNYDRHNEDNERYESERYDDYHNDHDDTYNRGSTRHSSHYNDSQRDSYRAGGGGGGNDNRGYEGSTRDSHYNDSRGSYRGSYRESDRGSDRGSNRHSQNYSGTGEVFAY